MLLVKLEEHKNIKFKNPRIILNLNKMALKTLNVIPKRFSFNESPVVKTTALKSEIFRSKNGIARRRNGVYFFKC